MSEDLFAGVSGLERALDFHVQRHGVLASNLANADTPGYAARDLRFASDLAHAGGMHKTHAQHMGEGSGHGAAFHEVEGPNGNTLDKNGVQVEEALAQITANRLRYETGIELTRRRMAILRYAANDGASG